jgi:HPt (histidine-containing phosphotransfer) domain-containing protein
MVSFNRELALDRVGGDEELLREVAGIFLCEYPGLVEQIRAAIAEADAEGLQRSAHTLKGSLLTMGAEAAAELAFALEKCGRNKNPADGVELLERLEAELGNVHEAVARFAGGG